MANSTLIDTTSLLTILGFFAAVWALISPTSRLRIRYCMAWHDRFIGISAFFLIHYLVFEPVLSRLGLYYSFGAWKWGFDSSSTVYLLILCVVIYFSWRIKSPTLAKGRVGIFRELAENLYFTKRYDELVLLVEPQLPKLIQLTKQHPYFISWLNRLDYPNQNLHARLPGEKPLPISAWQKRRRIILQFLKSKFLASNQANIHAHEILLNLVTSPDLIVHLALNHPYFCIKLLESEEAINSDFISPYMDALLDTPSSRLYVELKNNQNQNGGSRLYLPENNRLLSFFFTNAAAVLGKGLSPAIGDALCRRLDEDSLLAKKLNQPIGFYVETGKFRCPINSGITLFQIMVHEGIHQGLQDHMWLHYFENFAKKILQKMTWPTDKETFPEWPTPFHYLLYRLMRIAMEWIEQCNYIQKSEIPEKTLSSEAFDLHFISKQATAVLGAMLQEAIRSEQLSESFQTYLLKSVLRCYIRLQENNNLADVSTALITSIIYCENFPREEAYRFKLQSFLNKIDPNMKRDLVEFEEALTSSFS
jgi:hypothetical protein